MKFTLSLLASLLLLAGCGGGGSGPESIALLDTSKTWTLSWLENLPQARAVILGFVNEKGRVLYVWAERGRKESDPNTYYLKVSYSDPSALEILAGSGLEKRVITLLKDHRKNARLDAYPPVFVELLQDRSKPIPSAEEWEKIGAKTN
jgi:hypothetical protein